MRIMTDDQDRVLEPTMYIQMRVGAATENPEQCGQVCGRCSLTDRHLKLKSMLIRHTYLS
jgi:hypothetical protein